MSKIKRTITTAVLTTAIVVTAGIGSVLVGNDYLVGFSDGDYSYNIPYYSDQPYIILNNNEPIFNEFELKEESYEEYSKSNIYFEITRWKIQSH